MTDTSARYAALPPEAVTIAGLLESAERPVITSHIRLDGDALGSELGLAHMLTAMGQRPCIVNDSPVPKVFQFLPRVPDFHDRPDQAPIGVGPLVILDTPGRERVQTVVDKMPPGTDMILIDHHPSTEGPGRARWVDTTRSSVGEMLVWLALGRGWPIPPAAATCLYVAIVTDTGRFTFPNTGPETFGACQVLLEAGADHRRIGEQVYQTQSLDVLRLRAEAVGGIHLHHNGRVATMRLTRDMFTRHGVSPIDTQEFADIPRSIGGVEVGLLTREMAQPGRIKASMRSQGAVDVSVVARSFAGGGHVEAAGCEVEGSIEDVESRVLARIVEVLG